MLSVLMPEVPNDGNGLIVIVFRKILVIQTFTYLNTLQKKGFQIIEDGRV